MFGVLSLFRQYEVSSRSKNISSKRNLILKISDQFFLIWKRYFRCQTQSIIIIWFRIKWKWNRIILKFKIENKNPSDQNTCFDVLYNSTRRILKILRIWWVGQSNFFVISTQKVTKCSVWKSSNPKIQRIFGNLIHQWIFVTVENTVKSGVGLYWTLRGNPPLYMQIR